MFILKPNTYMLILQVFLTTLELNHKLKELANIKVQEIN